MLPLLAQLMQLYPELRLEARLRDDHADLVRDGLDAAVRVGDLRDSSLIARRFDWQELVLVASPAYLAERGTPRCIEDLASHDAVLIRMPSSGRIRPWQLREGRRDVELEPSHRIALSDGEGMVTSALLDLGIAQVPDNMVGGELQSGRLIEVLPDKRPARMPVNLVMPSSRLQPPRVKALVDALDAFRSAIR